MSDHAKTIKQIGRRLVHEVLDGHEVHRIGHELLRLVYPLSVLETSAQLAAIELDSVADNLMEAAAPSGEWDGTEPQSEAEYHRLRQLAQLLRNQSRLTLARLLRSYGEHRDD